MEKEDIIKYIKEELQNLLNSDLLKSESFNYSEVDIREINEKINKMRQKNDLVSLKIRELNNLSNIIKLQNNLEKT